MGDHLIMNTKERLRKAILEQVIAKFISHNDAKKRLNISARQLKRILSRYKHKGDIGLIHRSRGKISNHVFPEETKNQILSLYQKKYLHFGPTFAAEKLEEDGLKIHPETLRLWLKSAGLWQSHRKRKTHRSRRIRRPRFGELLQLDGSIHSWFTGDDKKQCLMNMVDDATGKTLALMDSGETTRAAFSLLKWWITEAGIPISIYVDLKSLYVSIKSLRYGEDEELVEPEWLTHFSKACKKLGIEIIKAYSPQAKGRVERSHAVYQDRFVKELALKGIKTIEGANQLLSNGFVNHLNNKFAKPPADPMDAHVPLLGRGKLENILCWEFTRQVKNDWTIQFQNKVYQIRKPYQRLVSCKQKVTVRCHLNNVISFWCKDRHLLCDLIDKISSDKQYIKKGPNTIAHSEHATKNRHHTPWGRFNPQWLTSKKNLSLLTEIHDL